jgi:hypothetical protein
MIIDPGNLRSLLVGLIAGQEVEPSLSGTWKESAFPLDPDMGSDRSSLTGYLFSVDTRGPVEQFSHTGPTSSMVRHPIVIHAIFPMPRLLDPNPRNVGADKAIRAARNLCRLVYRATTIGDVTVEDAFVYGWSPVDPDVLGITVQLTLKYEQEV